MKTILKRLLSSVIICLLYPFRKTKKRSSNKNILLLVPYLNGGGAERACVNLANALKDEYNVTIVICKKSDRDFKTEVRIVEVPELEKKLSKIKAIAKLKALKRELKIDACISYLTTFNFINIASFVGEKTIITNHNYLSQKKEGFIPEVLHAVASRYADKIVNCSEAVEYDQYKTYSSLKQKMTVIPNFIDVSSIRKQSEEEIFDEDIKNIFQNDVILSCGRLAKHKGNDTIILAFSKIQKKLGNTKLVFLGDGSEKKKLKCLVQDLNLEKNVIFLDYDVNPYKYIKNSKLLVLASTYEGLPITVLEAIALNVPVIATDCFGGSKEILDSHFEEEKITKEEYAKNGMLFPINDVDALSRLLVNTIKNQKIRLRYTKNTDILNRYSKDAVIEKWKNIIEKV